MADKMACDKCGGRVFLDRTFSDNKDYEVYCLLCGKRKFIQKSSEFGEWLTHRERLLRALEVR